MKKILLILFFLSCQKKVEILPNNYLKLGNETFALDFSIDNGMNFDNNEYYQSFKLSNTNSKGNGKKCSNCNYIYLRISCYSANKVTDGSTFQVANTLNNKNQCYIEISSVTLSGQNNIYILKNGNLQITKYSNKNLKFSIKGETLEGVSMEAFYEGEFNDFQ